VTPDETALVLAKAALVDMRTIGEPDVMAWHEILADVELNDALAAVTRHYRDSTDRIMPAHVRKLARAVKDDRTRLEAKAAPRELPGRFETDTDRDERKARGMAKVRAVLDALAGKWSMPR
jgi:hypothetical protein